MRNPISRQQANYITEGGGDNSTPGGVVNVNGRGPFCVQSRIPKPYSLYSKKETIRDLFCKLLEKGSKVWLVDIYGNIYGWSKDSGTTFDGIPASAFGMKERDNRGANSKDINSMQFTFGLGWSQYLYRVAPEAAFNPITF